MPTIGFDSRRLFGATLVIAALSFGAAGCGGGDDSDPPAPATTTTGTTEPVALTTEELIAEGDAICAEVNAALGSIAASTADETTKSSQVSDIYEGLATRLGELGTPSDGEPPSDVIAAVKELGDGETDTTELQAAATDYGFSDCADAPEAVAYPSDSTGVDPSTDSSTGTDSSETYVPPATTEPAPAAPATPPADTGGGVAPSPPPSGGGTSGGSSGGSSTGGIGPG